MCSYFSCDQQAGSKEDMITHKKNQHASHGTQNTERKYKDLEDKYNLLKENYERLIQLNKKSETSQKDRELALETQNEELRIGYEKVKAENIKLQDNLDTQNKLWKIWIQNFETNKIEVDKEQKSDKKSGNNKENDEIAIIEEEGIDNDIDDEETELIFQNYLQNLKKSGFRRTNPGEQAEPQRMKSLKCIACNFIARDDNEFKEHLKFKHTVDIREKMNKKGQNLKFCHYWNNYGNCTFESRNGRPCKFQHKNAPRCKFDGNCDRKFCMFVHKNQNMSFLLNAQPKFRHQSTQRGFIQNQSNQFSYQTHQGEPMNWGNTRRF